MSEAKPQVKKVLEILNSQATYRLPAFLTLWRNIYFRTSIHTTGTCPSFYPLRYEAQKGLYYLGTTLTYPTAWINGWYDQIFDDFLLNRHPKESNIIREWRKSVYRPYQQAALQQCIDKVKAIISSENKYTLKVENKDDNDYIWGANFDGRSLVDYVFHHFKTICEDPNSIFLVLPKNPYNQTNTAKVEPYIKHVPTYCIIYWTPTELIFREDPYAWYVNDEVYLRFKKVDGTNDDNPQYELENGDGYYAHMLGYSPTYFAGGVWNTHGYYDSYLKPAQAFCDDFVAAHSALQLVNKEAAHPYIIAASRDCPECEGTGKYQYCATCKINTGDGGCNCEDTSNYQLHNCGTCNGSGQQSFNPSEWLVVPPDQMGNDLIKIVNPDVSVNKYLSEHAASLYDGIRRALHQQHIDEAQSGKAKEIDREGEYLFYQNISNGVWHLIEMLLKRILEIRNTSKSNGEIRPDIANTKYLLIKPTQFDIKTEQDLLSEYETATKSQIPAYIRSKQASVYVDKLYGGDDVMVRKSELISELDPYSVVTIADKTALITSGVADARTMQFSSVLPSLIDALVRRKGEEWFLTSDVDTIAEQIKLEFEKVPKVEKPESQNTEIKQDEIIQAN